MKKNYLLIVASLLFVSNSLFAQLANGGFENWTPVPYFNNPTNWATSNGAYSTTVGTVTRWGIKQEGTASVSIESKEISGKLIPGFVTTGKVDTSNLKISGGQPSTERPLKLTGFYHYTPASGDLASFEILLSKWNNTLSQRDTIAYGQSFGAEFSTGIDWASFEVPLVYKNMVTEPDTQLIIISSSKDRSQAKAGSALWLDNVKVEGLVTGIEHSAKSIESISYPNPVENELTFRTNENAKSIAIFDVLGNKVEEVAVSAFETKINTSTFKKGLYFYTIVSANKGILHTSKFTVK